MSVLDTARAWMRAHDERGRLTGDRFRLIMRKRIRRAIGNRRGYMLDAGGGDGLLFDPRVWTGGGQVVVLDTDTRALAGGRLAYDGSGRFVCGDITGMPFGPDTFDVAVCVGTFYNFPDGAAIARGLTELARVVRTNGAVFTEFRNADNPAVRMMYRHARSYDPSLGQLPLHAYGIDRIRAMHTEAGLDIRRVIRVGMPLKRACLGYIVHSVRRA